MSSAVISERTDQRARERRGPGLYPSSFDVQRDRSPDEGELCDPGSHERTLISTRRFSARPARVVFGATGFASP